MSRLLITLTIITSTLFTSQIPDRFDTDSQKEETLSGIEKKEKNLESRSLSRNSRNDVNDQKYFNGNRWYLNSTNDGRIGNNYETEESAGKWPRGQSQNMIYSSGLWIGSMDNFGNPSVSGVHWNHSDFTPGELISSNVPINHESLSGTWRLSPNEGAMQVGPMINSADWWQNSPEDVETRWCIFDDEYVFNQDGTFDNIFHGETWVQDWQSDSVDGEGCFSPVYPHDNSNDSYWSLNAESSTVTVYGAGAYLGIAQVINGGELWNDSELNIPDSISYDITYFDGNIMVLSIGFDQGYWTFTFEKDNSNNNLSDPYAPESRVLKVNRWDNTENSEDYSDWTDYGFTPKDSSGNPSVPLDQSLFSIYNDNGDRKAEVRQVLYGGMDQNANSPLNDAVFVRYEIENKSQFTWNDAYVSMFCDFDFGGDYYNDLVSYDHDNTIVYYMNDNNNDGFNENTVFGLAPVSFDYELTSVIVNEDPEGDHENYNLQQGLHKDGSNIIDPTTGDQTTYMFSGNIGDSLGWVDNEPGDKFMLVTFSVGNVEPGETVELDLVLFVASTQGDNIETQDEGAFHADHLRMLWGTEWPVSLYDRPIIETEANNGFFGGSIRELNVAQGDNVSNNFLIRNGGPAPLVLDIDMGDGNWDNTILNYGETHEVYFSFDAPYLDDPKTIRVPQDTWDIYAALDSTTASPGHYLNYYFMHNDSSTKYFDMTGEYYVEHAGDTVLVAPGGDYQLNYEIFDRSVHLISYSDSSGGAVFTDSSFLSIRGRVPHFSFKGFRVENNSGGFLDINDYGDQWSTTQIEISDNIFRNNYKDGHGTAIYAVNVDGNISNNIFENNHAEWMGGAIYLSNISCDVSHNVFLNNSAGNDWGGGAMRINSGAAHVYKNTFFDNHTQEGAKAIAIRSQDHVVTSNIFWGGEQDLIGVNYEDYYNVEHNLVQGGFWDNVNNIDIDPMMNNPWDGDFTLQDGSPCIDSGHPDDFYNDPDGSRSDMGAYYFDQSSFSMEFNGDSHLRVNNNPSISNFDGELSISAWVKITGEQETHRNIISKTGAPPQSFSLSASNVFRPHVRSQNGTWYNFDGTIPIEHNTWTHVAFSYSENDGLLSLYVNGQFDSSISISGSVNNNNADMYIGHNVNGNGNAGNFIGLVDELSIWNRAFNNDDIHSLMNLSLSGEEENLLGYWNFNDEDNSMVYDLSPYGNHAENINGAGYSTDTPPVMNATLGEFDFLVNGSGSSAVISYRDPLDLTFVHENYSDTIYFEVFRDMNFNGQLDDEDYNWYKHPDWSWSADNGIISVVDQGGIQVGNHIGDNNPGLGITSLRLGMNEGIDQWAWIWIYIQNSTYFIKAYDHHGNENIVSIQITGSASENYISGRTHPGEYSNLVVEVMPEGDSIDSEYDMPYLASTGYDGNYHIDLFDSVDFSYDYNFAVFDPFFSNNQVAIDYQEHQNSGMDWFNNPLNIHGGTYGIDLFFTELENSISGTVFVNGEQASGGLFHMFSHSYDYYYYEDSSYFESNTIINQDGSYEIWYDEPRYFMYETCAHYWNNYDNERCKSQDVFLPEGSHHVDIHITDNELMYHINGTVRDTMGNPIYGAEVTAYAHEEYSSRERTFTDWDGNFTMMLYGDGINYDLEAGGEGWIGNMYYIDSYQIEMGDHFEFYLQPSESGGNLIYNGGFEEGFNGWWHHENSMIIGTGMTMWNSDQSFEAFEGDSSFKFWGIYNTEEEFPVTYVVQEVEVQPGMHFDLSAWLNHHEHDFIEGENNAVLAIDYYNENWERLSWNISLPFDGGFGVNDWHHMNLQSIAPENAVRAMVGAFYTQLHNQNGGVYIDEFMLQENHDDQSTSYFEGFVYDENGEPVNDGKVYLIADDQSYIVWPAFTDSSGYYNIPVKGDRGYFISASRSMNLFHTSDFQGSGFEYQYANNGDHHYLDLHISSDNNNEDPIVEGWLRDWYTGEHLSDATILFAYDQDGELQTIEEVTDADGYFMTQVPADREYDLFIYKDGYWAEHDAFYLSYGDHYVLEIGIAPLNMAARVYGSVTDANNGDIIHGAEAVLHCGDSEDWDHTGALGTYRVFSYYPENCEDGMLSVWADGYQTQHYPAGDIDLQAGESITINIAMEEGNDPEPAVMLGRIHAASSGDGIAYAQVNAYSHNTGDTYGVEADSDGHYFLELIGDQDYSVQVTAEGFNEVYEDHFIGAYDSLFLDFYLDDAPQSRFFGYVTNTNGDSLSDVRVYFQDQNGNWSSTRTDGFGHYSKYVYPGNYEIIFANNDYYVFQFDSVFIHEDEERHIDVTLEQIYEFDGAVAGIVYGENGSTLSDVYINVFNYTYDVTAHSNEEGVFYIELVNGTYDIEFWKEGYEYVYIPDAFTVENNIVTYDMSLVQPGVSQPPVIVHLEDVPNDQGRQLDMAWSPGDPQDLGAYPFYSVWRERNEDLPPGAPQLWHFISMVPYHEFDLYNMIVPTLGDSTDEGLFMSTFMVTAHTDDPTVFFDSSPMSAYSIDNIFPAVPDSFSVMTSVGEVSLSWSSSVAEDFAYYNIYRNSLMDDQPAIVFTTISSSYVDTEVDASLNYEYWVTAVDHSGNESNASVVLEVSGSMLSTVADLIPEVYALNQNYPNPFNPSTQIRYALPEQSQVVLTVYDMLGRKVRTLVNDVQDAGYRTVMWNATSDMGTLVSAGMYIYTIRANEFYQVKKMILLK